MKIYFSVGEPSGDLHAANLIRRLKSQYPDVHCVGYGGPKMAEAGCELHFDLTSMAVMFFSAVWGHLGTFLKLLRDADQYFNKENVDAVVLIDYPGFNWWIARKAKKHGIPVFYYGVPQVWAWAPWRVRKIRKFVDHVLCKLPFEVDWFSKRNCHATYVGHPYFDQLAQQSYDEDFVQKVVDPNQRLITLLPGSRDQEVKYNLPILLDSAVLIVQQNKNVRIAVACYNDRQKQAAAEMIEKRSDIEFPLFVDRTPELIKASDVCLACSGSVSLELLHHRKPTVIVYRIKPSIMLAQSVILRTKFITLVNLIASKEISKTSFRPYDPDAENSEPAVMPEYLTTGNPAGKIAAHVNHWLSNADAYREKVNKLDVLAKRYAKPGATERAADYILEQLVPNSANDRSAVGQNLSDSQAA